MLDKEQIENWNKMKLEIGKTYIITNRFKKTVVEVEQYLPPKPQKGLNVNLIWRSGTFLVTPQNQDEIDELLCCHDAKEPDDFCTDTFEEWEMDNTWDGVDEYFSYWSNWTETEKEVFDNEYDNDPYSSRYDFLTEQGYMPDGCTWYIENGIEIEPLEE